MLPYVLQALRPTIDERLVELGQAMGVLPPGGQSDAAAAQSVVDAIADLCRGIGVPVGLDEIGVSAQDVTSIVDLTLQVGRLVAISPRTADRALIERIVAAAVAGERSLLIPSPASSSHTRPD